MKKTIGELTLNEVVDLCKKCDEKNLEHCPFINVLLIDCFCNNDTERRIGLDKELEDE